MGGAKGNGWEGLKVRLVGGIVRAELITTSLHRGSKHYHHSFQNMLCAGR